MKRNQVQQPHQFKPLLIGVVCGLYPLLFYYSNNYSAINSWEHFGFFTLFFIGISVAAFYALKGVLHFIPTLRKYQNELIFIGIVTVTATLMSQAMYLTLKKKMLAVLLVITAIVAWRIGKQYYKVLVLIGIMAVIPLFKNLIHIYEHHKKMEWAILPDDIMNVKFKKTPNVYLIQPDGYVSKNRMESEPYNFQNPFYDWLTERGFKRYDDFRSNYPASLTSNSSLLSMKQHKYGDMLFPSIEMPKARDFISGKNSVTEIFKNNGYHTFFIVKDEYFQQNRPEPGFDYYNIDFDEIPYFSNDNNVKKDVLADIKAAMDTVKTEKPRFYFIEKLLPHHIHFSASKEEERETYLEKIVQVNDWLKETVSYIEENDSDAIIIILADHGGWVDIGSYDEMFTTTDANQLHSIFSTLAAIRWNGNLTEEMDSELRSNVNLFRILFANLSEDASYLKYLEDNSSYNLKSGSFRNSVQAVLDDTGNAIAK